MNNNLLKQIAVEAGFIASAPTLSPTLEKFAELLVRECARSLEELPRYYKQEDAKLVEEYTIFDCVRAIKEHFGVK
jgi:hypothetical protein